MQTPILDRETLRRTVPSVFATRPIDGVSDRYAFLPTSEVIDIMGEAGFFPVKASQSTSRDLDRRAFTRHQIRFRHADHLTPALRVDEFPEIVLTNSHDKSSAYGLSAGIHRLVCQNGLTVASASLGSFSIRHSGSRDTAKQIIDTTAELAARMPAVMQTVQDWKGITLTRPQQLAFAEQAATLKPNAAIKPAFLLTARRPEDSVNPDFSRSLYVTMNVVQEWLIGGGITARNERGRQIRTRPVKAVAADLAINRKLWRIAEQVAELN